jgi:predicted nucleic acid-binding Zn ribbon protein
MAGTALTCENCGAAVTAEAARRRETMGDLNADRWQTLCCPACGARLKTVLVRE